MRRVAAVLMVLAAVLVGCAVFSPGTPDQQQPAVLVQVDEDAYFATLLAAGVVTEAERATAVDTGYRICISGKSDAELIDLSDDVGVPAEVTTTFIDAAARYLCGGMR